MTSFDQIATKIIQEQELVIGPLAWKEAEKVAGLRVDPAHHVVTMSSGDPKDVVNRLVRQYERLFGRASHEVCRDATAGMIAGLAPADIPSSLLPA